MATSYSTRHDSRRFYSILFTVTFADPVDLYTLLSHMDWQVWTVLNRSAVFYIDWDDLFDVFTAE